MVNSSKTKASFWYGYLKAGDRSSPVLRDARLDTGNRKTLYLFNLERGEILEYAREIVEKKLRELKPAESGFMAELDAGYKKARREFKGRVARLHRIRGRGADSFSEKKERADDNEINELTSNDTGMCVEAEEL
jgi:hypothetical protein